MKDTIIKQVIGAAIGVGAAVVGISMGIPFWGLILFLIVCGVAWDYHLKQEAQKNLRGLMRRTEKGSGK